MHNSTGTRGNEGDYSAGQCTGGRGEENDVPVVQYTCFMKGSHCMIFSPVSPTYSICAQEERRHSNRKKQNNGGSQNRMQHVCVFPSHRPPCVHHHAGIGHRTMTTSKKDQIGAS